MLRRASEHPFHVSRQGACSSLAAQLFARFLNVVSTWVKLVGSYSRLPKHHDELGRSAEFQEAERLVGTCSLLGTLLGSNAVNILVFAVGAPLMALRFPNSAWQNISGANIVSVVTALLLTAFVLVGIVSRSHRAGRAIARTAVALMVPVYLLCLFLVYRGG